MACKKKEIVPTKKGEIIAALAAAGTMTDKKGQELVVTKAQAQAIYDRLIDLAVKGAKQEEKGYMLPGIGKVKLVKRPARTCRNPATGEMIKCKAKKVAKILACKSFKDAILG